MMVNETNHYPRRDDQVAEWLKRMRDKNSYASERFAINVLLDRYRECADYGLSLSEEDDEHGDP
jgi:hypothetical protein